MKKVEHSIDFEVTYSVFGRHVHQLKYVLVHMSPERPVPERHKDSRFWHVSTSLQRNVGRANMVYNIHALHQKPGLLLYVHVLREEERAKM